MNAEKKSLSYLQKYGNTRGNDLLGLATAKVGSSLEDARKTLSRLIAKGEMHRIVHSRLELPQVYSSLAEPQLHETMENLIETGVPEDLYKKADAVLQEAARLAEKRIERGSSAAQYQQRALPGF